MNPTRLRITRARLEDLTKVARLEQRVWKEMAAPITEIRRRFFLFPQGFKVARMDQEIAGFCCACLTGKDARAAQVDEAFPGEHVPQAPFFFLFALTVNPVYRGRGVGSRIIKAQIETALERDCLRIQAVANERSERLFRDLGFAVGQQLPHLFADFEDQMPRPVIVDKNLRSDSSGS